MKEPKNGNRAMIKGAEPVDHIKKIAKFIHAKKTKRNRNKIIKGIVGRPRLPMRTKKNEKRYNRSVDPEVTIAKLETRILQLTEILAEANNRLNSQCPHDKAPVSVKTGRMLQKAGAPSKFQSPEEMQAAIETIIKKRMENTKTVIDKHSGRAVVVDDPLPITMLGIAYDLGFTAPEDFGHYAKKFPEFIPTIKRLRLFVEQQRHCDMLRSTNQAGYIFDLKVNHGWREDDGAPNASEVGVIVIPANQEIPRVGEIIRAENQNVTIDEKRNTEKTIETECDEKQDT